jgi:hypothetical protein
MAVVTPTNRLRLAAILGMLGSEHQGERAAAALQAEAFRRKHGLTWEQIVSGRTVYVDREVPIETAVYVDRPMPLIRSIVTIIGDTWSPITVPGFFGLIMVLIAVGDALSRVLG